MREAAKRTIPYTEEGLRYIAMEYYTKPKRKPRGVHPRDILDGLVVQQFNSAGLCHCENLIPLAVCVRKETCSPAAELRYN